MRACRCIRAHRGAVPILDGTALQRPLYATSSQRRSIACRDATTAVLATFLRLFDMHQTLSIARIYTRRPREAATDAS